MAAAAAAAAAAAQKSDGLRERIPLLVSINVHELPNFVLLQLRHIRDNLPVEHRILLNCNEEMLHALRATEEAAELCNPEPLTKRRYHGSLLQGIMRNLELALRRWDFDQVLVLSSRSWFRRPLTLRDLHESYADPPGGPSDLRYTRDRGLHWVAECKNEANGREDEAELDVAQMLAPGTAQTSAELVLAKFRQTRLARELEASGHALLHAPHEGLLLECAACEAALKMLSGPCGAEIYAFDAAVEEFALQSIARSRGLRFAQLGDMGHPCDGDLMAATGDHLPPLTKTVRK